MILVMEILKDECYVVVKAYIFTVLERFCKNFILPYIACLHYPYIYMSDDFIVMLGRRGPASIISVRGLVLLLWK